VCRTNQLVEAKAPLAGDDQVAAGARCREMSVMISKLGDENSIIFDLVDKAMLVGDSARPISREAMLERFGFA
jgi:hypothetical protein